MSALVIACARGAAESDTRHIIPVRRLVDSLRSALNQRW